MGAWGTGVFNDDNAWDYAEEAMRADARSFIEKAVESVNSEYIEFDQGHEINVAAAILDSLLNGTVYDHELEDFADWLNNQSCDDLMKFKPKMVEGLKMVISDESELNEEWQPNGDNFNDCKCMSKDDE